MPIRGDLSVLEGLGGRYDDMRRKPIAMTLAMAVVLIAGPVAFAAEPEAALEGLVSVMTDPAAAWQARCDTEDALKARPSQPVLQALLPHAGLGMPPGAIWNSGGREFDQWAPVKWQIFYAVARSWSHHVSRLPKADAGRILVLLLEKAGSAGGRRQILNDLAIHWTPEAEPPVAALFNDAQQPFPVRRGAGFCLMLHEGKKYHERLLDLARDADVEPRKQWFDLLSDPRHKRNAGYDPRVAVLGFELIEAELRKSPDYIHGAYFLAVKTADYVGVEFAPNQGDPKYKGDRGMKEAFFADTVKNALAWWKANGKSLAIDRESSRSLNKAIAPTNPHR
jgi:hypothetical protein